MTRLIETARLRLVLQAPSHLLALIESVEHYEAATDLQAAEGLRDFFVSDDVSPDWLDHLRFSTEADPWTHGFAVVHKETDSVIGSVGFKGPPNPEGMVEIGYGIVPTFQGRGYATEAAQAVAAFAFGDERVRIVRAHTLPSNTASARVLAKCGFQRLGEVVDPDDGLVWRWERTGPSPSLSFPVR